MWMLVLPNITHITLFPLNTAVWLCISCFRIWLDWSYGALSNISEVLKITWMLHKIILNIALARQLTTIYTVTMLFSHVSSYEVELCVNPNLLKGDESLIFTKCVVYWDGLFHFVVRSCLVRFSAWELTNSTRAWAGEFCGPVLHWRHSSYVSCMTEMEKQNTRESLAVETQEQCPAQKLRLPWSTQYLSSRKTSGELWFWSVRGLGWELNYFYVE